jgi:hypothetical protein
MLNTLHSLTNGSILIFDNTSDIDFDALSDKTVLLFTSSQAISSMKKKLKQGTQLFLLEDDKNEVDHRERFASSEDLIWQLADELYRYYKQEASDDFISGHTLLSKKKEELADQIHNELTHVHKKLLNSDTTKKQSIRSKTTLIWLQSNLPDDIIVENVQKLSEIVSFYLPFTDEKSCYYHVCQNQFDNSVFLIIDTHYKDSVLIRFQKLPNVKHVYRYGQSLSNNMMSITNCGDLCFQLTHDLITHYNNVGTECDVRKDPETANDMFLKASELCKLLVEF